MQCTVSSTLHMQEEFEFLITCKSCNQRVAVMQNADIISTPGLLQQQEPQNSPTLYGAGQQSGCEPLASTTVLTCSSVRKKVSKDPRSKLIERSKACHWGLRWKKNGDNGGIDFRLKHILLKGKQSVLKVQCNLCKKPYNSDLMYISCETCESKSV